MLNCFLEDTMKISANNPCSFKYPLLQLVHTGPTATPTFNNSVYTLIEVDGQIEKYIEGDNSMTPLMIQLIRDLAEAGVTVQHYSKYNGSGGPGFLLRHGILFRRADNLENPPETAALAVEMPTYVTRA